MPSPSNAAPTSRSNARQLSFSGDAPTISRDGFGANATTDSSTSNQWLMPEWVNLHESGLCHLPHLQEQAEQCKEKAHITWSSKLFWVITLFTLFLLVSKYKVVVPSCTINPNATYTDCLVSRLHEINEIYNGTLNSVVLYAFSTVALDMSDNKVFTCTKALQQPDTNKFIDAMDKEINDNQSCDHWEFFCCNMIHPRLKTIQAIWFFKHKRFPNKMLNKHKARLCVYGGMQQWGVSYWETYSPVVNMLTVCLLIALCNIHGLHSKSINFVLAFPQDNMDVNTWMELPMGIVVDSCESDSHG